MNKYDKRHIQNLAKYERQIQALFEAAMQDAANLAPLIGVLGDTPFAWEDYPLALAQMNRIIEQLNSDVTTSIVNGVRSEWTLSNNKNNELCNVVFGSLASKLPEAVARRYYSTNEQARDAFLARKEAGLGLSDRVWRYTDQFKSEIELSLDAGIRSGRSADEISRDIRDYLKYPDKLFRRVRDDHGQLHLSKRAAAFHPGRGVYRSSYMNARRLAATETNIAYRTADHLRWQQLDFVVGIEIHLSNNHNCKGVPAGAFYDICDELKGKYPKDFKFVGWHPHCRCYATSILKTEEEMDADNARIMAGEEVSEGGVNEVSAPPEKFNRWLEDNAQRIDTARARGTLPYFMRDNTKYTDPNWKPSKNALANPQEQLRAPEVKATPEILEFLKDPRKGMWEGGSVAKAVDDWTAGVESKTMLALIENSEYTGQLFRAIDLSPAEAAKFIKSLKSTRTDITSILNMGNEKRHISWSPDRKIVREFYGAPIEGKETIIFHMKSGKVRGFAMPDAEDSEVVLSGFSSFRMVGVRKVKDKLGEYTLVEVEPINRAWKAPVKAPKSTSQVPTTKPAIDVSKFDVRESLRHGVGAEYSAFLRTLDPTFVANDAEIQKHLSSLQMLINSNANKGLVSNQLKAAKKYAKRKGK